MKQCTCGCQEFWGYSICCTDVLTDGNKKNLDTCTVHMQTDPFGPFTCNKCGKKYVKWEDIPEAIENGDESVSQTTNAYGIVFLERSLDDGIRPDDLVWLASCIDSSEFIPLEVQGEHSTAIGLISLQTAKEMFWRYDENSSLVRAVREILEDMDREQDSFVYSFVDEQGERREFILSREYIYLF